MCSIRVVSTAASWNVLGETPSISRWVLDQFPLSVGFFFLKLHNYHQYKTTYIYTYTVYKHIALE